MDIILMVAIIGGAVYLLYRSLWKGKAHCAGCELGSCEVKKKCHSVERPLRNTTDVVRHARQDH